MPTPDSTMVCFIMGSLMLPLVGNTWATSWCDELEYVRCLERCVYLRNSVGVGDQHKDHPKSSTPLEEYTDHGISLILDLVHIQHLSLINIQLPLKDNLSERRICCKGDDRNFFPKWASQSSLVLFAVWCTTCPSVQYKRLCLLALTVDGGRCKHI